MNKLKLVLVLVLLFGSGCTSTNTVYLYDGSGKTQRWVNDIPAWKDADIAQSENRYPRNKDEISRMKCLARPISPATIIARVGKAVEVKVQGNCRGFVNETYVHDAK